MEYDAITAGVDPGGINNSQQVRLLVCYMLRSVKDPIDRALLPELIQYYSLANYFEVMQAIDELVDKGSLLLGENGELTLSDKGRSAIDEWEFILPLTVKEKAARAAVTALTKLRTDRENKVDITPEGARQGSGRSGEKGLFRRPAQGLRRGHRPADRAGRGEKLSFSGTLTRIQYKRYTL